MTIPERFYPPGVRPWKFQMGAEGKASWFKVDSVTPGSSRTSTPILSSDIPTAAGRPTPEFVSEPGVSVLDQTIRWETKGDEQMMKAEVSAKASHHHHVEVMHSPPHHPWHLCFPPPSCPSPAPYAYRAFAGACLGAAHPGSHPAPAAVQPKTFAWKHEGDAHNCSQGAGQGDIIDCPAAETRPGGNLATSVDSGDLPAGVQREEKPRRRRARGPWVDLPTRAAKYAAFRLPANNTPTSSSEDEDTTLRVRVTRSELKKLRKYR